MFFKNDVNIFIFKKKLNKTNGKIFVKSQQRHTYLMVGVPVS